MDGEYGSVPPSGFSYVWLVAIRTRVFEFCSLQRGVLF